VSQFAAPSDIQLANQDTIPQEESPRSANYDLSAKHSSFNTIAVKS